MLSAAIGRDILKGSGRAPNGIDFLKFAEPHAPLFIRFGGHASAFGFSALTDAVDAIMRTIDRSMDGTVYEKKEKYADLEIMDIGEITDKTIELLSRCEPWGYGNEPPLFLSRGVPVLRVESFGSDGRHGKFLCGGRSTAAVGWSMAAAMKEYDYAFGADMLYAAECDPYTRRVRFIIDTLL